MVLRKEANEMKKRFLILGLMASALLSLGVACTQESTSDSTGSSSVEPGNVEITLNGFEFLEKVNYYYGSCVDIYLPLVTDNIGNAIDVYYTVKDSKNVEVDVESGKFFAMDKNGYVIEYSAKAVNNQVFKYTQKIKVVESYISEEAKLIDVKGKTSYNLFDAFPEDYRDGIDKLVEEQTTVVEFVSQLKSEEGEILSSTEKDVSTLNGVYKLSIKAPMGIENTKENVYSIYMDFYNSDEGMVWLNNQSLSLDPLYTKADCMTEEIVTTDLPTGAQAMQYFYITDDSDTEGKFIFSVGCLHSAEYYEMWKEKGLTALLVDIYWTSKEVPWSHAGFYTYSSSVKNYAKGQWITLEIPIEVLIAKMKSFSDIADESGNANLVNAYYDRYDFQMWIGNFRGKIEILEKGDLKDAQSDFFQ